MVVLLECPKYGRFIGCALKQLSPMRKKWSWDFNFPVSLHTIFRDCHTGELYCPVYRQKDTANA